MSLKFRDFDPRHSIRVFGRYLRKGHYASEEVGDALFEARQQGQITELEEREIWATNLLWGGEERQTKQPIILVIEATQIVEIGDVTRARGRADILTRLGLPALALVDGEVWTETAIQMACNKYVVQATNSHIDHNTWQVAWSELQTRLANPARKL